jgi:hypothetical protein
MKPELAVKRKVKALERRKALLDALITFLKKHPDIAAVTDLHQLTSRTGLLYEDVALIRPIWVEDRVTLRLEKYSEDWEEIGVDYDPFDPTNRTIHDDISEMSDKELEKVFKKLHEEAKDRFGDFDDDEEDEG